MPSGTIDFFAVLVKRLLGYLAGLDHGDHRRIVHVDVEHALVPVIGAAGVDGVATVESPLVRPLATVMRSAQMPLSNHAGPITSVFE